MGLRYSVCVNPRQTLPQLFLLSDARNDRVLEPTLESLPGGSGFIFRHYHCAPAERIARYRQLWHICRKRGHLIILADSTLTAREWCADGVYGAPRTLFPTRRDMITLATAHTMAEIAQANRARADAVLLSPAFATRSHPGAPTLGAARFRALARHAKMPVIALGGMNAQRARALKWPCWAAIDGLSCAALP